MIAGFSGWFFTRKKNKLSLKQKDAEISKLKADQSKMITDLYQDALTDLKKRYEDRASYMEKEYERRHEDLKLDYDRKYKLLREEKDQEIDELKKKVKNLSNQLDYWKKNAEGDYMQVPISVLKYISELEEVVKNCSIPNVVGRSEQFNCFGGNYCKGIKPCEEWCGDYMCQKPRN